MDAAGRISDGRRLQGQSEHLFNFQLGYEHVDTGAEFNLLINFASERIRSGESLADGLPAILEQPPVSVDLVYNLPFTFRGGEYEFSFNAENLLGDGYEAFQEGGGITVDVDSYDIGPSVSLGIKRSF